ncbi:MAG: hypothetical protein GWO87_03470 [Xanthomonadaceae bacterium]|nr:hypothetical protein [Rhodospirillaceae bacterium]NIA18221.1 hypothetical protein [Xanthomonadaceae bacterium]
MEAKKEYLKSQHFRMIKKRSELKNVFQGQLCYTTNYEIFKIAKFNRGEEKGFILSKLTDHTAKMKNKTFYPIWGTPIECDPSGKLIDGHHRVISAIKTYSKKDRMPLIFRVCPPVSIKITADINSTSIGAWTIKQMYKTALSEKMPLAERLYSLFSEFEKKYDVRLELSDAFNILHQSISYNNGKNRNLLGIEVFESKENAKKIDTKDFQNDFDLFVRVYKILKNRLEHKEKYRSLKQAIIVVMFTIPIKINRSNQKVLNFDWDIFFRKIKSIKDKKFRDLSKDIKTRADYINLLVNIHNYWSHGQDSAIIHP